MKMHADQVDIKVEAVQRLIAAQFPQWQELPAHQVTSHGTVNALFRLGDDMVLRFPLRPCDGTAMHDQLVSEMRFLREVSRHLPLDVPSPIDLGKPGEGYDGFWTVYRWITGETADVRSITDFELFAYTLGDFVKAMHQIDTGGRVWDGESRGGPLRLRDKAVRAALAQSVDLTDTVRLAQIWEQCLAVPNQDGKDVWIHADLMPGNLLIRDSKLVAVLDFEMACIGDPAVDLMPAWNLMPSSAREIYRKTINIDDATWVRGQGWALSQAIIALPYYIKTNPAMAQTALQTLNSLLGSK